MSGEVKTVLAIDPGSMKCGAAVVACKDGSAPDVVHHAVIETDRLGESVADLEKRFHPDLIVIGNGTTSSQAVCVVDMVSDLPVELVDEKFTSELARKIYFKDNPPRGLRRLIPISLQTPARPYDDYVAIILAERYFRSEGKK
ncbi:pre-16S rRNA-processing nuclease YqgF [bacterium]|nr:pre-16S rRNA-processing nuclease YqgF [bacterium]